MDVDTIVQNGAANASGAGDDFDENAVYKGTVKNFRSSFQAIITPNDDLSAIGLKANASIKFSASDILTTESPVYLEKGQAVEFRLKKDEWGVYGGSVTGPNGDPIGPGQPPARSTPARTSTNGGQVYTGSVKNFMWAQGFGYITFDDPDAFVSPEFGPEKVKKKFDKNKELWFARDDIRSTDAAIGVEKGDKVRFQVYTDEKGIGAQSITTATGAAFSGKRSTLYRGPKKTKPKKKKKGGDKRNAMQAFGGGNFQGAQIVMMNGMPFMMMPVMGGGPKKKRKKNKKKKKAAGSAPAKAATDGTPITQTAW